MHYVLHIHQARAVLIMCSKTSLVHYRKTNLRDRKQVLCQFMNCCNLSIYFITVILGDYQKIQSCTQKNMAILQSTYIPNTVFREQTQAGSYHRAFIILFISADLLASGSSIALSVSTCLIRHIDFLTLISFNAKNHRNANQ